MISIPLSDTLLTNEEKIEKFISEYIQIDNPENVIIGYFNI